MGKTHLNVSVSTYETEFDMQLRPSATGKNLFDAITATTGIREVRGGREGAGKRGHCSTGNFICWRTWVWLT